MPVQIYIKKYKCGKDSIFKTKQIKNKIGHLSFYLFDSMFIYHIYLPMPFLNHLIEQKMAILILRINLRLLGAGVGFRLVS